LVGDPNVTQALLCYQPSPSTINAEGCLVVSQTPVADLCRQLLRRGFAPDTGLIIREHESGPIIRRVPRIDSLTGT
jgi:hypothetical protein